MSAPTDPPHVLNQHVCILLCREWDRDDAQIYCRHSGQKIQTHCLSGQCPHPAGPKFTDVTRGGAPVDAVKLTRDELWKMQGPQMWGELHIWTRAARLSPPDTAWLTNWLARIMCGDCKRDAMQWVADHPPDWGSRDGLFVWGVEFHNYVNAKLDKAIMSVEDAARRWDGS